MKYFNLTCNRLYSLTCNMFVYVLVKLVYNCPNTSLFYLVRYSLKDFFLLLLYFSLISKKSEHFCGGAMIAENWVLTGIKNKIYIK